MGGKVPLKEKKINAPISIDEELSRHFENYRSNFLGLGGTREKAKAIRFCMVMELIYGAKHKMSKEEGKLYDIFLKGYINKEERKDPRFAEKVRENVKQREGKKW